MPRNLKKFPFLIFVPLGVGRPPWDCTITRGVQRAFLSPIRICILSWMNLTFRVGFISPTLNGRFSTTLIVRFSPTLNVNPDV